LESNEPVAAEKNRLKRGNPSGDENSQRRKKNKHARSNESVKNVGPIDGAKPMQVLREHSSEELKHDGSESEVETPDPDYELDDGFVVGDSDELEFDSDALSEDIPYEYQPE
jgi:hypothetical protein